MVPPHFPIFHILLLSCVSTLHYKTFPHFLSSSGYTMCKLWNYFAVKEHVGILYYFYSLINLCLPLAISHGSYRLYILCFVSKIIRYKWAQKNCTCPHLNPNTASNTHILFTFYSFYILSYFMKKCQSNESIVVYRRCTLCLELNCL